MTTQLVATLFGALAIAAVLGGGLFAAAWLIFWSLEERPETKERDELRKH